MTSLMTVKPELAVLLLFWAVVVVALLFSKPSHREEEAAAELRHARAHDSVVPFRHPQMRPGGVPRSRPHPRVHSNARHLRPL